MSDSMHGPPRGGGATPYCGGSGRGPTAPQMVTPTASIVYQAQMSTMSIMSSTTAMYMTSTSPMLIPATSLQSLVQQANRMPSGSSTSNFGVVATDATFYYAMNSFQACAPQPRHQFAARPYTGPSMPHGVYYGAYNSPPAVTGAPRLALDQAPANSGQPGAMQPPIQAQLMPPRPKIVIIDPETGEDVMDRYRQESKSMSPTKDRQKIDIRSPSGEPLLADSMRPSGMWTPSAANARAVWHSTPKDPDTGKFFDDTSEIEHSVVISELSEFDDVATDDDKVARSLRAQTVGIVEEPPIDEASDTIDDVSETFAAEPDETTLVSEASDDVTAPSETLRSGSPSAADEAPLLGGKGGSPEPAAVEVEKKATDIRPTPKWALARNGGSGDTDVAAEPTGAAAAAAAEGGPLSSPMPDVIPEHARAKAADKATTNRDSSKGKKTPSPNRSSAAPTPPPATPTPPPATPTPAEMPTPMQLTYKDGQYRPDFPEGSRIYDDRNFLLVLKHCPHALSFPTELVNNPRLDILKQTPDGRSKVAAGNGAAGGGPSFDFTPSFARGSVSGPVSGSGGMTYGRGSSGGNNVPKRPSQGRRGGQNHHQQHHQQSQQKVIQLSVDEPKLNRDPNAWKPGKKVVESDETPERAELYKKVRGILNKLTPQKFDTLVGQVKELEITDLDVLQKVIDMVFEKACDEPGFATAYARMCCELATKMRVLTEDGQEVYFRKALLMKCQREFEAERLYDENRDEKLTEIENADTDDKKKELQLDLQDKDRKMKRRYLGTIRFIGELFVMSMLTVKIMHECVGRLLSGWHKRKDEDSLECLCKLLNTIGAKMDDPNQASGASKASSHIPDHQEKMKRYFGQMQAIVEAKDTSSRVRFMLLDVIDLRAKKWVPRREDNNPKTIDQIHREAEAEEVKRNFEIGEAKQRARDRDRENQNRSRGERGTPGSRGSQQQNQEENWTRVAEANKKHERQNMLDRQKFDPSRLQACMQTSLSPQGISLGPPGGGIWTKGSSAGSGASGRTPDASSNKFAALGDDRNRNSSSRFRQNTQESRQNQRGFRGNDGGVRPSSSVGSSVDSPMNRADDARRHGATASMILSRERDPESVPLGPQRGGTPFSSAPDAPPPLVPRSGVRSTPVDRPASSSPFKGSPRASPAECADLSNAITRKHCSEDCDVTHESVSDVIDMFHEKTIHLFLLNGLNLSLDKRESFRKKFGILLSFLVQLGLLPPAPFIKGLSEFVAKVDAEDLLNDVPMLWTYVGQCLAPVFTRPGDRITLADFRKCKTPHVGKILAGILRAIATFDDPTKALGVWQKSGLTMEDFAEPVRVQELLRREKLEFMGETLWKPEWVSEKSSDQFRLEFTEFLRSTPVPLNDPVIAWLEKRVPEKYRSEGQFIRALVYSFLDVATTPGSASEAVKFEPKKFLARIPVMKLFINNQPEAEMQALVAATHISADKNHPRGLVTEMFENLDDSELITEETFNKWYANGSGIRGYGIAHEAVKQFFFWMKNSTTEEEAAEEKAQ